MATIVVDGFDDYGPPVGSPGAPNESPPLNQGKWTIFDAFGKPNIAPGLSGQGYCVQFNVGTVGNAGFIGFISPPTHEKL